MRINHKSDFDFRLDLYAADPYGTAVSSGFPDCDFSGKLFIGPSVRSRQCYIFSKSGNTLVNCFDCDGHLHIVVSGHKLNAGPLFCELTLKVDDNRYPGGLRTVVHTFPLNIYLTETDAEQISPTVSVTLPMIQKAIAMPPVIDDPTEEVTPTIRATSRLAEPWLSPRVCGGHFRTGAYVGNVYRNNTGMIFLSGHKNKLPSGETETMVHIPTLLKLGIKDLTIENLLDRIKCLDNNNYKAYINGNNIFFCSDGPHYPSFYLEIPQSAYASIDAYGKIKYYRLCPMTDYEPTAVSFDELQKHVSLTGSGRGAIINIDFGSTFIFQVWGKRNSVPIYKPNRPGFTIWKNVRKLVMKWNTKRRFKERVYIRPLFFRVARKKHGRVSEWLYFKIYYVHRLNTIRLIQTDETGASMTDNSIVL